MHKFVPQQESSAGTLKGRAGGALLQLTTSARYTQTPPLCQLFYLDASGLRCSVRACVSPLLRGGDVQHLEACSISGFFVFTGIYVIYPERGLLHQLNSSVFGIVAWLSSLAALVAVSNGFTS